VVEESVAHHPALSVSALGGPGGVVLLDDAGVLALVEGLDLQGRVLVLVKDLEKDTGTGTEQDASTVV